MRGTLLGYDIARGEGVISGTDGNRYRFSGVEWKGDLNRIKAGVEIDFDTKDASAVEVYPVVTQRGFDMPKINVMGGISTGFTPPTVPKSHVTAGVLALFFGVLGIHKFYMGYDKQGWTLLGATILSLLTSVILIGIIPLYLIGLGCFVEAIILFTKDQAEFERVYFTGARPWF